MRLLGFKCCELSSKEVAVVGVYLVYQYRVVNTKGHGLHIKLLDMVHSQLLKRIIFKFTSSSIALMTRCIS